MSSRVGTVVVGGFPSEKEAATEKLEGQHSSSAADPNFPFEQGKPQCMSTPSYLSCHLHFMLANVLCTYRLSMGK
jgi:hypothetical protein